MRLYPSSIQMIVAFQLLHIWFKGEPYFSWWWIVPLIFLLIFAGAMSDKE